MLTIVRGLPGSGKSTLALAIQNNDILGARIFEADDYFITAQGYQFDPSKLKEAHHICQVKTKTWLTTGRHAIVSNTFTQRWEYQPYLDMAAELGVPLEIG